MAEQILYDITFEGLDESNRKIDQLNQQLIEQKDVVNQTKKEIKALENERKKEGRLTSEQSAKLEKLNKDLLNQQDQLKNVNSERRGAVKESQNYNKALQAENGSNEQLKAQLAILTKRYNGLSKEQREGTDAGKNLQSEILGITNKLKGNEKAIGDNRRNVGNYEEAITSALGKVNIMGVNLGQLTTEIKSSVQTGKALATSMVETATATTAQATATKGATVASGGFSKALRILRIALISIGIGAIVVVLGSLVAAFLSTQRGINAVQSVLKPLTAQFQTLIGIVQNVSTIFVDIFQGKADFKDLANEVSGVGEQLSEARKRGERLYEIMIEIQEINKTLASTQARLNVEIEKQRSILQDVNKSDAERAFAGTQVLLNEARLFSQKKQVLDLQIEELQLKQEDNKTTDEELKQLDELIAKRINLNAEFQKSTRRDQNQINQISKRRNDEAERERQEQIKLQQQRALDNKKRLEEIEAINRSEIEAIEYKREQKLKELKLDGDIFNLTKAELEARRKINSEYNILIAKINEKKEAEEQALLVEEEEKALQRKLTNLEFQKFKELEQENLTNEQKLKIERKFQQDKAQIELEALTTQAEKIKRQLEPLTADASGGLISPLTDEEEQKLKEQLNTINAEMQKISQTVNGVEGETEGIKLQNALGLDDEGMQKLFMSFDIIGSAIIGLSDLMNSVTERNKKALDEQVKAGLISQEEADKELEKIEKKAFKRQKAFNLANAIMQGVMAQARIWGEVPKSDFGASTITLSATSAALTAANIASIAAQKFATGGEVKGAGTKTSDSIPAMLSNGEYVVQADAVRGLGTNFLDMINSVKPRKFATGGLVTPQPIPTTSTNANKIGELKEQVQSQEIRVINVEQDFSSIQNRVRNVERAGTF